MKIIVIIAALACPLFAQPLTVSFAGGVPLPQNPILPRLSVTSGPGAVAPLPVGFDGTEPVAACVTTPAFDCIDAVLPVATIPPVTVATHVATRTAASSPAAVHAGGGYVPAAPRSSRRWFQFWKGRHK